MDTWLNMVDRLHLLEASFTKMIKVTPQIFADLERCKSLALHVAKVTEWAARADDVMFMLTNMGKNVVKNGFSIGALAVSIPYKAAK